MTPASSQQIRTTFSRSKIAAGVSAMLKVTTR
jgi:hypothetical protein